MLYEVEFVQEQELYCHALIKMLTGRDFEEITAVVGAKKSYPSREFIRCFRALGYDCSARFKPFDKATEYPVLMRALSANKPGHWYAFVYYNGVVFDPQWKMSDVENFSRHYPGLRITSMVQVWIKN